MNRCFLYFSFYLFVFVVSFPFYASDQKAVMDDGGYMESKNAEKRFLELSEKLHVNMSLLFDTLSKNKHYIINDSDRALYDKYFQKAFSDNYKDYITNLYLNLDQIATYKRNFQAFNAWVISKKFPSENAIRIFVSAKKDEVSRQVQKKFPVSLSQMKSILIQKADEKFTVYKRGMNITFWVRRFGAYSKITGKYYGMRGQNILVDNKLISFRDISPADQGYFHESGVVVKRNQYVTNELKKYSKIIQNYQNQLMLDFYTASHFDHGFVVISSNDYKLVNLGNVFSLYIQRMNTFLDNIQQLSDIISKFPELKYTERDFITAKMQNAEKSIASDSIINELNSLLIKYPYSPLVPQIKTVIAEKTMQKEIDYAIRLAERSRYYNTSIAILEEIIEKYPNTNYILKAKALLKKYQQKYYKLQYNRSYN